MLAEMLGSAIPPSAPSLPQSYPDFDVRVMRAVDRRGPEAERSIVSIELLFVDITAPLVALVSLIMVVRARRNDRQVRRQARSLQSRLEADLEDLRAKSQRTRQRVVMIADVYCRGTMGSRGELTRGIDELIAKAEQLRGDLYSASSRLGRVRRRELRDLYNRIADIGGVCRDLSRAIDEQDRFWKKQLAGVTSLSEVTHERPRARKLAAT